jgi:hypothetical protein
MALIYVSVCKFFFLLFLIVISGLFPNYYYYSISVAVSIRNIYCRTVELMNDELERIQKEDMMV